MSKLSNIKQLELLRLLVEASRDLMLLVRSGDWAEGEKEKGDALIKNIKEAIAIESTK